MIITQQHRKLVDHFTHRITTIFPNILNALAAYAKENDCCHNQELERLSSAQRRRSRLNNRSGANSRCYAVDRNSLTTFPYNVFFASHSSSFKYAIISFIPAVDTILARNISAATLVRILSVPAQCVATIPWSLCLLFAILAITVARLQEQAYNDKSHRTDDLCGGKHEPHTYLLAERAARHRC